MLRGVCGWVAQLKAQGSVEAESWPRLPVCVGHRFPLQAVTASTVGSRFEKKMGRFEASEVGGVRQTDRRQTVLDFALSKTLGKPRELLIKLTPGS